MASNKDQNQDLLSLLLGLTTDEDDFKKAERQVESLAEKLKNVKSPEIKAPTSGLDALLGGLQKAITALELLGERAKKLEISRLGAAELGISGSQKQYLETVFEKWKDAKKIGVSAKDIEADLSKMQEFVANINLSGETKPEEYIAAEEFGQHFRFGEMQGSTLGEWMTGKRGGPDEMMSFFAKYLGQAYQYTHEHPEDEKAQEVLGNFIRKLGFSSSFTKLAEMGGARDMNLVAQLMHGLPQWSENFYDSVDTFTTSVKSFELAISKAGGVLSNSLDVASATVGEKYNTFKYGAQKLVIDAVNGLAVRADPVAFDAKLMKLTSERYANKQNLGTPDYTAGVDMGRRAFGAKEDYDIARNKQNLRSLLDRAQNPKERADMDVLSRFKNMYSFLYYSEDLNSEGGNALFLANTLDKLFDLEGKKSWDETLKDITQGGTVEANPENVMKLIEARGVPPDVIQKVWQAMQQAVSSPFYETKKEKEIESKKEQLDVATHVTVEWDKGLTGTAETTADFNSAQKNNIVNLGY